LIPPSKKKLTAAQKRAIKTAEDQLFEQEYRTLITSWIKHFENQDKKSRKDDGLLWTSEKLSGICRNNPEVALKVITAILSSTQHELALSCLAAGPLEDLLSWRGDKVIGEIEKLARRDPHFRSLLQGVWQGGMPKEIWSRVLKASDRS
jgi:hypothetical protein